MQTQLEECFFWYQFHTCNPDYVEFIYLDIFSTFVAFVVIAVSEFVNIGLRQYFNVTCVSISGMTFNYTYRISIWHFVFNIQ